MVAPTTANASRATLASSRAPDPRGQHEVTAKGNQGHDADDDSDRDRDGEERCHRGSDCDEDHDSGGGQGLPQEVQRGDRTESQLSRERDRETLLEELQHEPDAGQRRSVTSAVEYPAAIASPTAARAPTTDKPSRNVRMARMSEARAPVIPDRVLANPDCSEAALRGQRSDSDHRLHRCEPAEPHDPEVSEKEWRREEA